MRFKLATRLALAVVLAATCLAGAPAIAQQTSAKLPAPAVVVIDIQEILRDASAAKAIRSQRDKYLQSYQQEFAREEDKLREADQELARQRSLLSPEAFADRRRSFEQQVAGFQRKVQERRRGLEEAQGKALQQINQVLIKITDELAQENGANLVLYKSVVFLLEPKMDITKAALERLNKRLPSVDFPPPQASATPPAPAQTSDKKKK